MQVMDRKTIMVSSTVYGVEDLLESIYDMLDEEYNVVMSHKGTVTNSSANSCYTDCEEAVRKCDIFLGILTPSYGSGITKIEPCSILLSITLDKYESLPMSLTSTSMDPSPFIDPPMIFSPSAFSTGLDSPVSIASFT